MASNSNLVSVVGLLLVLTLFHIPITVVGQKTAAAGLFTFGDSNFDAGNKQTLTTSKVAQGFWPYGKSQDNPTGKLSDGLIAPDFLATFMGIPSEIPPALKANVNMTRGASYAVADATLVEIAFESLTLNQQIRRFNGHKGSNIWTDDYIKKSVFLIYIGANDYLTFMQANPTADASAQQAYVVSVTNKLRKDIEMLYASGAVKFVIQTLAPLGCLPIVRQDYNTGLDKCYEPLNDLAKQHNDKLGPMLNDMAKANPGFQFTVFDFYNATIRRIENSSAFRFMATNTSCCGVGSHDAYGCGLTTVHSRLCEYQRSYLFFDGRHNTEKAQEMFAHLLLGADTNVIQPMNVRELVAYPVDQPMRDVWEPKTSATLQASDSTSSSSRGYESY